MNTKSIPALTAEARSYALLLIETLEALVRALSVPQILVPAGAVTKRGKHLTDAGIDALYEDFATGTLKDKELAEKHQISPSGVAKRKVLWKKGVR